MDEIRRMSTMYARPDKAQYTLFFDFCNHSPCCGGLIPHWQRTKLPDARSSTWGDGTDLTIYTDKTRPRYHRCYECAAKLFEAERKP